MRSGITRVYQSEIKYGWNNQNIFITENSRGGKSAIVVLAAQYMRKCISRETPGDFY